MSQENVDVLQEFARAINAWDLDAVRAVLHDEVVVYEAESLPYGGEHRGPDAFIELTKAVKECWEFTDGPFRHEFYDAGPDTVIFRVEAAARAPGTGVEFTIKVAEFVKVRDRKIAEMEVFYWDTAEMLAARGPTETT